MGKVKNQGVLKLAETQGVDVAKTLEKTGKTQNVLRHGMRRVH